MSSGSMFIKQAIEKHSVFDHIPTPAVCAFQFDNSCCVEENWVDFLIPHQLQDTLGSSFHDFSHLAGKIPCIEITANYN